MHALDLLTEDCWKEILSRVEDPEDLWSCSQACLTFQEILRRKRHQFMFDLILPDILEYLPESLEEGADEDEVEFQQLKAALKCRLVCKSWCRSVDELREDYGEDVFEHLYQFDSGEKTERFLKMFANHTGNPIFGRTVTLVQRSPLLLAGNEVEALNAYGNIEAFHIRKLRELLERFGSQIWSVEMLEETEHEDDLDLGNWNLSLCKNIQNVLGRLPNLNVLRVHSSLFDDIAGDGGLGEGNMAELTAYIAKNPIPDLPQLEYIRVSGVNVGMLGFILEKYAPNLKYLFVDDPRGFPEQGLQMSKLKTLEFTDLDASTSLRCLRQLQAPQLRHLELTLSSNGDSVEVWPMDELFRNIQHLPIQSLEIDAEDGEVLLGESGPIPSEQRPYHQSITSVDLTISGDTPSFNFLLYCPQLTSVCLVRDSQQGEIPPEDEHPVGVPELLDVKGMLEQVGSDFYQSNIWEHLPLLEDLSIGAVSGEGPAGWNWKWDHYDRDAYEERKNQPKK